MKLAGITASAVTASFLVVAGIYSLTDRGNGDQNAEIRWEWKEDEAPPEPIFNDQDSEDCILTVEGYYEQAVEQFESNKKSEKKLNASYQQILDKQSQYGIELVDNDAFPKWSNADWDQTWEARNNPDAEKPDLDWSMRESFISAPNSKGKKNLRSLD